MCILISIIAPGHTRTQTIFRGKHRLFIMCVGVSSNPSAPPDSGIWAQQNEFMHDSKQLQDPCGCARASRTHLCEELTAFRLLWHIIIVNKSSLSTKQPQEWQKFWVNSPKTACLWASRRTASRFRTFSAISCFVLFSYSLNSTGIHRCLCKSLEISQLLHCILKDVHTDSHLHLKGFYWVESLNH